MCSSGSGTSELGEKPHAAHINTHLASGPAPLSSTPLLPPSAMPFTALSAWLQCAEFNGKPGVASFKKIKKKKKEKPANYLDGMQKVLGLFIVAKSEVARFHIYTAYICCIYGMKLCVLYIVEIYCI